MWICLRKMYFMKSDGTKRTRILFADDLRVILPVVGIAKYQKSAVEPTRQITRVVEQTPLLFYVTRFENSFPFSTLFVQGFKTLDHITVFIRRPDSTKSGR